MGLAANQLETRGPLITGVCLAVAGLAFFSGLNSYGLSANNAKVSVDSYGAARAQARMAPVIARIPAADRVGYFTDLDPKSPLHASEFLAVQHALAPRQLFLLGSSKPPVWAVGNFSKPQDYAAAGANRGYGLVTDFGNGVVLFRRTGS